jgi:hypothetical protein
MSTREICFEKKLLFCEEINIENQLAYESSSMNIFIFHLFFTCIQMCETKNIATFHSSKHIVNHVMSSLNATTHYSMVFCKKWKCKEGGNCIVVKKLNNPWKKTPTYFLSF